MVRRPQAADADYADPAEPVVNLLTVEGSGPTSGAAVLLPIITAKVGLTRRQIRELRAAELRWRPGAQDLREKLVHRVSICIPTYNSARFLPAAVESVLAQTYHNFELVVCDNASTDATPEICGRYQDPRLRTVRFEELVGQAANWNRCVELARGELVILLHADDMLRPEYLERAVSLLDAEPEAGWLFCGAEHVDADGRPLRFQRAYPESRSVPGRELARRLLLEGCLINPAGVLVRRGLYETVGRFTEAIVWGVDWHMWARLALEADAVYLGEPQALYRIHGQSGTSGVMATARNGKDEVWMMNDLFSLLPPDAADLRALRPQAFRGIAHRTWCFAEEMCQTGFPQAARAQLRRAASIRPPLLLDPKFWALWAATFVGYERFARLHQWKALSVKR